MLKLKKNNSVDSFFYDKMVFSKIKNTFGGNIKFVFSAPMDKNLM